MHHQSRAAGRHPRRRQARAVRAGAAGAAGSKLPAGTSQGASSSTRGSKHKQAPQPQQRPRPQAPKLQRRQHEPPAHRLAPTPTAGQQGHLQFDGDLRHAQTAEEAYAHTHELLGLADASSQPLVVGLDSETGVKWLQKRDGSWYSESMPVSLLQLAYHPRGHEQPTCLLLPLSRLGLSEATAQVLAHPNILKVGVGIVLDVCELQQDYHNAAAAKPQGLLDLDWLAVACQLHKPLPADVQQMLAAKAACGLRVPRPRQDWGLAGLVQATTQHSLLKVKKIQTSNWARPLTPAQVAYAAADAYAALLCYHALQLRWLQLQQPEQQQQKQPGAVPLTLALPGLTQPGACFAALAAPAQLQQRWHDTVVRQGTANADTALQRACEAAAWKAEAGESALWNDVAGADTAVPPKKREVWEQTWM